MKITKTQLKQIIKEEIEKTINEALAGGIDEFAKDLGIEPLPHGFTDQQLVEFTYAVLEATESHLHRHSPGDPDATMPPMMARLSGPRNVPMKHGQTHKQSKQKYHDADIGQRQVEWHPLTSTTALDPVSGEQVPVGMALEKLIQERFRKSQDPEMRKQLQDARMALLNAVSPSGRAAYYAKGAQRRSDIRRREPDPSWSLRHDRERRGDWSKQRE